MNNIYASEERSPLRSRARIFSAPRFELTHDPVNLPPGSSQGLLRFLLDRQRYFFDVFIRVVRLAGSQQGIQSRFRAILLPSLSNIIPRLAWISSNFVYATRSASRL
jgi:hypothetical protein